MHVPRGRRRRHRGEAAEGDRALATAARSGLVEAERAGRYTYYRLRPSTTKTWRKTRGAPPGSADRAHEHRGHVPAAPRSTRRRPPHRRAALDARSTTAGTDRSRDDRRTAPRSRTSTALAAHRKAHTHGTIATLSARTHQCRSARPRCRARAAVPRRTAAPPLHHFGTLRPDRSLSRACRVSGSCRFPRAACGAAHAFAAPLNGGSTA